MNFLTKNETGVKGLNEGAKPPLNKTGAEGAEPLIETFN
jgi:hypothetical protein